MRAMARSFLTTTLQTTMRADSFTHQAGCTSATPGGEHEAISVGGHLPVLRGDRGDAVRLVRRHTVHGSAGSGIARDPCAAGTEPPRKVELQVLAD